MVLQEGTDVEIADIQTFSFVLRPAAGLTQITELDPFDLSGLMAVFMAWFGYVALLFGFCFAEVEGPDGEPELRATFLPAGPPPDPDKADAGFDNPIAVSTTSMRSAFVLKYPLSMDDPG